MNPERIFDKDVQESEIQELFTFYGFKEWKNCDANISNLIRLLGGDPFFVRNYIVRLFTVFKGLSDPDRSFNNFLRFLENSRSPFMNFHFIFQDLGIARLIFRIFSDSQFFSDILVRYPDFFDWLLDSNYGYVRIYDELFLEAKGTIEILAGDDKKIRALRRFQKKHMLRIGANDLLGRSSLEQTVMELSNLADVCMQMVYQVKKAQLFEKYQDEFDVAILSMGKLGGQEVNYSSDIDLIFVGSGNMELATQLAIAVSRELSVFSEEGYFYRVDTRLRPEGAKGELVISLEKYENYFDNRAKVWERQAYLKARVSAGSRELGNSLMEAIGRFIFKKYLTIEEVNVIKKLKKNIESKAHQKKEWEREVKIGYGGIRDIEFFVQLIQLLYGGKYPRLKTGNTLNALKTLYEIEFISYSEYHSLYENYVFLRRIEHFLQIMDYQQTHVLPEKEEKRRILAVKMGFKDLLAFERQYKKTTEEVRSIFKKYFEEVFEERQEKIADAFFNADSPEDVREILEEYGFKDVQSAFHLIQNTGISAKNEMLFFSVLEDIFFSIKGNSFYPEKSLVNIIRIIKAYRGEDVFFDIMKNSPDFLKILVKIASFSDFMVQIIEKNPSVLDFLAEPSILNEPTRRKDLARIFRSIKSDMGFEKALSVLYEMEIFRIGCQDILGLKPIEKISYGLSILAETILYEVVYEYSKNQSYPFAFIFLGKIAGRELSYHSDLDLVVISESSNPEATFEIGNLIQKVLKTVKGIYELDLRLRPNGKNAPLAVGLDSFEKYLKEEGENWERLVYCRGRVNATSFSLREKILKIIERFVHSYPKDFKSDIVKMRNKISSNFPEKNFKKHLGGIMDIEFILEYDQILSHIVSSSFMNIIKKLKKNKHLDHFNLEILLKNLFFFRSLENSLRLLNNNYSSVLPEQVELISLIALKMGLSYEQFMSQYSLARETTLAVWRKFESSENE